MERSGGTALTSLADGDAWLHELAADTDAVVEQIGTGYSDRPLWAVTIGAGRARVAVIATQHGDEPGPREGVLAFMRDLAYQATDLHAALYTHGAWTFVPTANPNGLHYGHRPNSWEADGGDLNRDWLDFAFPETQAMRDWIAAVQPALALDLHEHQGTTTTSLMATGRQSAAAVPAHLAIQSAALNAHIGDDLLSRGWTWEAYADGVTPTLARVALGNLYRVTTNLSESDRTADLIDREGVNRDYLESVAAHWLEHSQAFENARVWSGADPLDGIPVDDPPSADSGLFATDGMPVALFRTDGTPAVGLAI